MRAFLGHWMRWTGLMLAPALIIGCGDKGRSGRSVDALDEPGLGQTVASVAEAKRPEPVVVEGYGLVGGLSGTGSPMCPSGLRAYLKNHILSQLPSATVDLDKVIDSRNTAVVQLVGLVPAVASKGECFDVRVRPSMAPTRRRCVEDGCTRRISERTEPLRYRAGRWRQSRGVCSSIWSARRNFA